MRMQKLFLLVFVSLCVVLATGCAQTRTGLSKLAESNYIGMSADKFFEKTQARRLTRYEVLEIRNNTVILGEALMSLRKQPAEYLRIFSYADGTSTIERRRQFDNSIVKTTKQNLWSVDDEGMISYRKNASSPPRRFAIYGTPDGKYYSLRDGKVAAEFRVEGPILSITEDKKSSVDAVGKLFVGTWKALPGTPCVQHGKIAFTIEDNIVEGHIKFTRRGKIIEPKLKGKIVGNQFYGETPRVEFRGEVTNDSYIKGEYFNQRCRGTFELNEVE